MKISLFLTIALLAYLITIIIDYSRATYHIKKLVENNTLGNKITDYNNQIMIIHTQIQDCELKIRDLKKDGKKNKRKIKSLNKRIAMLNQKTVRIKEASNSLNRIANDIKRNPDTNFSVNKLRQVRRDLRKYLYNSHR
ncbi:hypothetical protein [Lactobacillus taiwanensis]|uniref:hypothetical protein n=1 Tax=Lactobacillus taiwanensis TaxID=508451 RepID=UPI00214B04CB|nr:hypothetical protein [Lactobacillus taiwanensis]MCR1903981.1 hypothetical protein [Lactobacillus taiwanensis]